MVQVMRQILTSQRIYTLLIYPSWLRSSMGMINQAVEHNKMSASYLEPLLLTTSLTKDWYLIYRPARPLRCLAFALLTHCGSRVDKLCSTSKFFNFIFPQSMTQTTSSIVMLKVKYKLLKNICKEGNYSRGILQQIRQASVDIRFFQ